MKRGFALWLLGLITGGVLCLLFTGSFLDNLFQEKEKLKVELFEATGRLQQLEKQLHSRETQQVQAVNIELSTSAGTLAELSLKKALAEITTELIGEQIDLLKPSLLIKLLDQRILTAEDRPYVISVHWVVIGEETTFNLSASPAAGHREPAGLFQPAGRSAPVSSACE